MIIHHLGTSKENDYIQASARIKWEDCNRPEQELYYKINTDFVDGFSCNPHSFLIACFLPAMHFGEERIFIDDSIDPQLKEGIETVLKWMQHWKCFNNKKLISIESRNKFIPRKLDSSRKSAIFLSGGVDSLSTLRFNHMNYSDDHPRYISDGLIVSGLEVYHKEKFDHVLESISEIARDDKISLIPVRTNIREIGPADNYEFWKKFWMPIYEGAAFASIAHAFSNKFSTVYLSSDDDIKNIQTPWGSHPLINHHYSSYDLSFYLFGITLSRFQKIQLISNWDVALRNLRVCNASLQYESMQLNCGTCEKCLRTKLGMLGTGVLEKSNAFKNNTITERLLESNLEIDGETIQDYGKDLINALENGGYKNFSRIIRKKKILGFIKHVVRKYTIEKIKEFDEKYFNGILLKAKKIIYKKGILG